MAVELKPKDVAPLRSDTHVAVCSQKALFTQGGLEKKKKRERERASHRRVGGSHTAERKFKTCFGRELTVTDEGKTK